MDLRGATSPKPPLPCMEREPYQWSDNPGQTEAAEGRLEDPPHPTLSVANRTHTQTHKHHKLTSYDSFDVFPSFLLLFRTHHSALCGDSSDSLVR